MFKLKCAHIVKWRKLVDLKLDIGNRITLISGQNGVGKSNLLSLFASGSGIVGSSVAKKCKMNFKPEFDNFFTIDTEELIKDYSIVLEYVQLVENRNNGTFFKNLRLKNDTHSNRGVRIIPSIVDYNNEYASKKENINYVKQNYSIGYEARVPIPTVFLSLSRIYPLGECDVKTNIIRNRINYSRVGSGEIHSKYREWYNSVIPDSIEEGDERFIEIDKPVSTIKSYYLPLSNTKPLSQSVGQDNLGCIISALLNFYILEKEEQYQGGILCVDEIDVSLHPDAQVKLIGLLDKLSYELNMQIIISSHSLTIIKEIIKRYEKNAQDYSVGYLTNIRQPYFKQDLTYDSIKKDLLFKLTTIRPRVKIYFEDDVAKDIFDILVNTFYGIKEEANLKEKADCNVSELLHETDSIGAHLGCSNLMQLQQLDSYFSTVLIILDGDASCVDIKKFQWDHASDYLNDKVYPQGTMEQKNNILFLPSFFPPEFYLYRIIKEYVDNEGDHMDFWRGLDLNKNLDLNTAQMVRSAITQVDIINKDSVKNKGLDMIKFVKSSNILLDYYRKSDHQQELVDFISQLRNKLRTLKNKMAGRMYQD